MEKNVVVGVIAAVLLAGAIAYIVHLQGENEQLGAAQGKPAAVARREPAAAAVVARREPGAGRVLTAEQHKAMLQKLDSTGGSTHSVWFATVPNNPEAASFQKQIQGIFEEAGWKVRANDAVTFPMKAGLFFLTAEEDPPDYVQSISEAFSAAGIQTTSGRGYRAFYQGKKSEDPNWQGFALAPDQDFVLAIGRQPAE